MSSRLKERGGAGTKVMASNPSKTLIIPSRQDKLSSQRVPLAASQKELPRSNPAARPSIPRINHAAPASSRKENPRPISAGRPSVTRISSVTAAEKENPRAISAVRASVARSDNPPLKPQVAVRFSTSSLPRGKFTDVRGDRGPRVSSFGEFRSSTGFRASNDYSVGKGLFVKGSCGNYGKSVNVVTGVLGDRRSNGGSGAMAEKTVWKFLDTKTKKAGCKSQGFGAGICASAPYLKPVEKMGDNAVMASEIHEDAVSIEVKHENGHVNSTSGSDTNEVDHAQVLPAIDLKVLDSCENKEISEGSFCIRNTADSMEKYCLSLHPEGQNNTWIDSHNTQVECRNTCLSHVHHKSKAVQLEDVCTDDKYPSKLHEKLALLEDKVQKIALEIKQTKDMLDKNKPNESRLVLSDIGRKVSGVEKAVDNMEDRVQSDFFPSFSDKFNSMQDSCIASNPREKTGDSFPSLKSLNHQQLEARFFPHSKLARDHDSSSISEEKDKMCDPVCSELNGYQKVDDGLIEENPIADEFLASLREELPKPKKSCVNTQMTHGMMVNKMQLEHTSSAQCGPRSRIEGQQQDAALEANERLEEFDTLENNLPSMACLGTEESSVYQLSEIGWKVSTGGWFVSEGEAVLLAHDDNSCSYYDIANSEVKSEYKPPAGCPNNLWGDCWLIRAPGIDGCSGRYVVAASAGNSLESGFCSWDLYTKDIKTFQVAASPGKHPDTSSLSESQSCWYRPCGPLLISASGRQKVVTAYDIRDGDLVMTWEAGSPVAEMEYSCPLQWRSRGKVIIAEREAITLWDVNSLDPHPTLSVTCGKKIHSLHVNNTDAEIGAGVRQRASSAEVEGNDGAFCTQDGVNVLDFRIPCGVGLKMPRHGAANALSMFSIGDSVLIGSTQGRLPVKGGPRSSMEHFSLRKGSALTTYQMPDFNSHYHHSAITQVWCNSDVAMGICGMGLHVFDAFKDEGLRSSCSSVHEGTTGLVKDTIGPDDLFRPTFDYVESRVLVISRDRPAFWRYLS